MASSFLTAKDLRRDGGFSLLPPNDRGWASPSGTPDRVLSQLCAQQARCLSKAGKLCCFWTPAPRIPCSDWGILGVVVQNFLFQIMAICRALCSLALPTSLQAANWETKRSSFS